MRLRRCDIKNESLGPRREMPETPRQISRTQVYKLGHSALSAKFEHFYPDSKGDRDTVLKLISISVRLAQKRQIDVVGRVTDF